MEEDQQLSQYDVIKRVVAEVQWARRWDENRKPGEFSDKDKPLDCWLVWMRARLCRGEDVLAQLEVPGFVTDKKPALELLRQFLGLTYNAIFYTGGSDIVSSEEVLKWTSKFDADRRLSGPPEVHFNMMASTLDCISRRYDSGVEPQALRHCLVRLFSLGTYCATLYGIPEREEK